MKTPTTTHRRVPSDTARLETDGIVAGLVGGGVLLLAAMVVNLFAGNGLVSTFQYPASIVMREHAFGASATVNIVAGLAVHASASILFGHLFGLAASVKRSTVRRYLRNDPMLSALIGAVAGAVIWLINVELIALFFYPWIAAHAVVALFLHTFAFGAPLGAMFMWLRKRRARLGQQPTPYPNQARSAHHTL